MTKPVLALFLLGAACFAQVDASQITKGTLPPARLPAPTATTLGGVKGAGTALACSAGETQNGFNSDGSPSCIVIVNGLALGTPGQVFVVNPRGTAYGPQTGPDVRDKGATTVGDQAANITSAWNAMGNQNQMQFLKGSMRVGSSITPNSLAAYRIEGIGGIGQSRSGTILNQTGATAYPVLNLDRQRDAIIGNFSISMNGVPGSIGILLSNLTATKGQTATHNYIHDINIDGVQGAGAVGIQIAALVGDNFQNNEGHVFWHNSIAGWGPPGGTAFGSTPGNSNARDIGFYENETSSTDVAYQMGLGSWHVLGGLTQNHQVALLVKGGGDGFYGFVHDEGSKQGIAFDPAGNGSNGTQIIMGNHFEVNNPDLTKYQWDLTYANGYKLTIGNYFNDNPKITKMVTANRGHWISIGDHLPNTTIANLPDLRWSTASAMIGTANIFSADIVSINRTPDADSEASPMNGLWIGSTPGGYPSDWNSSTGLVVAANYTDGTSAIHEVPFRFKTLLSNASGTSPAIFKLLPPTDPVTGTNYAGPLDIDFQTNGHNFATKNQISTTYSTTTNCAVNSVSPAACGSAASGAIVIPTTITTYTVNTTAVTAHSRIFLTWLSFASDLPRAPTCVPPAATTQPTISNIASEASFTIALGSTTGQTCVQYEIKN
jgi:hypothetical protein